MTKRLLTPTTMRGKEIEAAAILKRVECELRGVLPLLKRDRDADQIRGKISAAAAIVELAQIDVETRL